MNGYKWENYLESQFAVCLKCSYL